MLDRVVIKPARNIKSHFRTAKSTIEYSKDGKVIDTVEGKSRERYPNTFVATRPDWSSSNRRWKISLDKDELNELVRRCKLSYEKGPKAGSLIETADIYDEYDPFFCHRRLKIVSQEGETSLLKDIPVHQIILNAIENNSRYGKKGNGLLAGNVKFIITDEQGDRQFELNQVNSEIDTIIEFNSLVHDKKLAIATALGFKPSDISDPDSLKLSMYAYIKSQQRNEDGLFNRDKVMVLIKENPELLSIKALINKAKTASVIRLDKGKGFTYNGNVVAKDEKEMISFLSDINNKETLEKIMDAIKEKS